MIRIVVTSYPRKYATGPMRTAIAQLFSLDLDITGSGIGWAENNDWFLECRLELEGGETAHLVTDTSHIYLEDPQGYGWFSRTRGGKAYVPRIGK